MTQVTERQFKSVENYLDEVSYDDTDLYIPTKFALEMVTFIKLVNNGTNEGNKTPVLHYKILDQIATPGNSRLCNMVFRGAAKALSLDTRIPTPTGYKTIGSIEEGDLLFAGDGSVTTLVTKSEVFEKPMYKITLEDGRTLKVSEDHINEVVVYDDVEKVWTTEQKTTLELLSMPDIEFPLTGGAEYPEYVSLEDPYYVGMVLGGGVRITGDIYSSRYFIRIPTSSAEDFPDSTVDISRAHGHVVPMPDEEMYKPYMLTPATKVIPDEWMHSSKEQRLALLQGLMDSRGSSSEGLAYIVSKSGTLAEQVLELVYSLGGKGTLVNLGNMTTYLVTFSLGVAPFRTASIADVWVYDNPSNSIKVKSIESIALESSQCLEVEHESHTFLAGDYVVTHNTTLKSYLILYLAVFGGRLPNYGTIGFAIYISDSMENGVKNMRDNLENRIENSPFLKKMIGKSSFTDSRWKFVNSEGEKFVVYGYGAKSGIRGTQGNNQRPQLAILDDIVGDDDARSPAALARIETVIGNAMQYAMAPKHKIIWSGTPFHSGDPLYKAIESGAWKVNAFPVCKKFPCTKEEFKGAWDDRFSYDFLNETYSNALLENRTGSFQQEMMLRIMSEDDRLVLDSDIMWYDSSMVVKNKSNFNFYITTDFATSEKQSSDFSVISVWALNNNGDWFLVDGICKRQDMSGNINDLFMLSSKWKPISVGIEVSGQQGGFIPWINEEMVRRNVWLNLAKDPKGSGIGIRPTTNKFTRFQVVQPWFKQGKIFLPKDLKHHPLLIEMVEELQLVAITGFKSKHDDAADTISMLASMPLWLPSEEPVAFDKSTGAYAQDIDYNEPVPNTYIV